MECKWSNETACTLAACTCYYDGIIYNYGDVIYDTHDGNGTCITAICGENGNITRTIKDCSPTTTTLPPTTAFTFTTTGKKNYF